MSDEPTADQVRRYLAVNGWDIGAQGVAATRWIRRGSSVRMVHEPSEHDLGEAVFQISIAENRHPADVRDDIFDVDNPIHAKLRAWAGSTALENAAVAVRRQADDAGNNGWPGVRNGGIAYAMNLQAEALAEVFEATAAVIRAVPELEPSAPWHPLWTAVGRAAEAVLMAELRRPDDLEEIKRRLDAMRAEAKETKQ